MKNPINTNLKGKVAVITGAGGVLCGMFSKALAEAGAAVAVLDLNFEAAQKVADEICQNGGKAIAYACNVLKKDMVEAVHEKVLVDLGVCDILVNGAGGNHPKATTDSEYFEPENVGKEMKTFFDLESEDVEFVMNLNFMGTLIPTQCFTKDMIGRKGCSILNISSMNGFTPLTKIPAYSGAKAGISNLTAWLAVHFSKVGIRVNAIAPGFFSTNQNKHLLWKEDGSPTSRTEKILAATPMERFGEAEELLGALLFLLNEDAASFITGVVLPIDGGFSAYSGV